MNISVIEFGALQSHWMLARWDASIPRTLERLKKNSACNADSDVSKPQQSGLQKHQWPLRESPEDKKTTAKPTQDVPCQKP